MHVASDTDASRTTVSEGELLLVAARAGKRLIQRQACVVEEMASERDFLRCHRVVGRHAWARKAGRQVPHVARRGGVSGTHVECDAAQRADIGDKLPALRHGERRREGRHPAFRDAVGDDPVQFAVGVRAEIGAVARNASRCRRPSAFFRQAESPVVDSRRDVNLRTRPEIRVPFIYFRTNPNDQHPRPNMDRPPHRARAPQHATSACWGPRQSARRGPRSRDNLSHTRRHAWRENERD